MELKIIRCEDDHSQDEYILRSLDDGDHIFVVPDRLAMSYEKKMFEITGDEASINREVVTLARLASDWGIKDKSINKLAGTMIIKSILDDNRSKFVTFKSCLASMGFSEIIYDTIAQFKSCEISPDKLGGISPKLDDLKIIYEEYEKFIDGRFFDSQDELSRYIDKLSNTDHIDVHFHFCHFDSFTSQGYEILRQLIKRAESVSISVQQSKGNNAYIYQNELQDNVLSIARELGVNPKIVDIESNAKAINKFLQSNLLSRINGQFASDSIALVECKNLREELQYVSKEIVKLIKVHGYRYRDITVAIPSLETNVHVVQDVFDEYGLRYYLDVDHPFTDTIVYRFVLSIYNLIAHGGMVDLLDFGSLTFVSNADTYNSFEDVVRKYRLDKTLLVESSYDAEGYSSVRDCIINKVLPLDKLYREGASIKAFNDRLNSLLVALDTESKLKSLEDSYTASGLTLEQRITSQEWEILNNTINLMNDLLGDKVVSGEEYFGILLSGLNSQRLSTVPVCIDNMFVSDVNNGMFDENKVVFVVGATSDNLPMAIKDKGIISDNEIDKYRDKFVLEPSVYKINLRTRQKALNLLCSARERLYVSYNLDGGATKSEFVLSIEEHIVHNGEPIKTYSLESSDLSFIEHMATSGHAKHEVVSLIRKIYDGQSIDVSAYQDYISYLSQKDKLDMKLFDHKNSYNLTTKVNKDRVSVSEIESFYTCPFKYFMSYTLNIKEREDYLIDSKTIGSILHAIAENYSKVRPVKDIRKYVSGLFDDIVTREYRDMMNIPSNKILFKAIKEEAYKLCLAIDYQLENSDYKLLRDNVEVRFCVDGKIKSVTVDVLGMKVRISGIVDRIDELKDYFRIIDYKTGATGSKLKELYYGKKIQLYVYGYIVKKSILKKCAGVYYMPVKREFSAQGNTFARYRLLGDTIDDQNVILSTDRRLESNDTSDIINVRKKKSKDGISFDSRSSIISEEELLNHMEYAMSLLKNACLKIMSGSIDASPLDMGELPCEYCPYKSICRYDTLLGNAPRLTQNIDTIPEVKYE